MPMRSRSGSSAPPSGSPRYPTLPGDASIRCKESGARIASAPEDRAEATVAVIDQCTYASHPFTDPGEFAGRLEDVPGDPGSLQRAACHLVFHYCADGNFAENNIAADRIGEIDTRYADQLDLLDRVARIMVGSEVTTDDLQELYAQDGFRVPPVVTSYTPAADAPLRVSGGRQEHRPA